MHRSKAPRASLRLRLLHGLLLCALCACGGGGSGGGIAESAPGIAVPSITLQPQDIVVQAGATATLKVAASNASSYQWYRATSTGWQSIPDATQPSLTLSVADQSLDGSQYRVVVRGANQSEAVSSTVTVRLEAGSLPPSIEVQPAINLTVIAGQNAAFHVTARGTALQFQWQTSGDGQVWLDAAQGHEPTLTLEQVTTAQHGLWVRVLVANSHGTAISAPARLSVQAAPMAPVVVQEPKALTVVENRPAQFELRAQGEPAPTVQWQVDKGTGQWANLPDANGPSLHIASASLGSNGWRYRAVLSNASGQALSAPATLQVTPEVRPPLLGDLVAPLSLRSGDQLRLSTEVSGSPSPSLQWQYSDDAGKTWLNINGATQNSYLSEPLSLASLGRQYRITASNIAGSVASIAVQPRIDPLPPRVLTQPRSQSVLAGSSASFSVEIAGDPQPALQWETRSSETGTWQAINGATQPRYDIRMVRTLSDNLRQLRVRVASDTQVVYSEPARIVVTPAPTLASCSADHWCWVNAKPQGDELHAAAANRQGVRLAVGALGVIVRSEDRGLSWQQLGMVTRSELLDVKLREDGVALACGADGTLLRSVDHGFSWSAVASGTSKELRQLALADSGLAFAVGAQGTILRSRDSGASWTNISLESSAEWRAVSITPAGSVLLAGAGNNTSPSNSALLRSTDQGEHWQRQSFPALHEIADLRVFPNGKGFAVGAEATLTSADDGQTWQLHGTGPMLPADGRIFQSGTRYGVLSGGRMYASETAETWSIGDHLLDGFALTGLRAVANLGADISLLIGTGGRLIALNDQQRRVQTEGTERMTESIGSLSFADAQTGLAAGTSGGGLSLLRSADGGRSWAPLSLSELDDSTRSDSLTAVGFVNASTAIGLTRMGRILRSADGGKTWSKVLEGAAPGFEAISEGPSDVVLAVAGGQMPSPTLPHRSAIWRSADGGLTWMQAYFDSASHTVTPRAVSLRGNVALVVGDSQTILRSNDSGRSWNSVSGAGTGQLSGVALSPDNIAIAVGGGQIQRSRDGGQTWALVLHTTYTLRGVRHLGEQRWLAFGDRGSVLLSTDAGQSWTPQAAFTGQDLLSFSVAGNAWLIAGSNGALLRHTDACEEPDCRRAPQSSPWPRKNRSTPAANAEAPHRAGSANARPAGPGTR